jgi:hypothetical protein
LFHFHAKAVVLLGCLRERGLVDESPRELEKLRNRTQAAIASLNAEMSRLGLPRELYEGDLVGDGRKCCAIAKIWRVARTLRPESTVWHGWSGHLRDLEAAVTLNITPQVGPEAPNRLWWSGEPHKLSPRHWLLVSYMWDRDKASVQDMARYVWEDEADEGLNVAEGTIRSTISKLNAKLQHIGVPWTLSYRQGVIVKDT